MDNTYNLLVVRDALDLAMELKEIQKQELAATNYEKLKTVKTHKRQILDTMQIIVNMLNQQVARVCVGFIVNLIAFVVYKLHQQSKLGNIATNARDNTKTLYIVC